MIYLQCLSFVTVKILLLTISTMEVRNLVILQCLRVSEAHQSWMLSFELSFYHLPLGLNVSGFVGCGSRGRIVPDQHK